MSYQRELSFGLDIGDHSVKVLQLHIHKKKVHLAGFAEVRLPAGILQNGEIIKMRELAAYIKTALQTARISARRVVTGLPETKTFLKVIRIESGGVLSLENKVETELQKHLPFELNEVWWDFAVTKSTETERNILAGAAPRTLVTSYTDLLDQAGLAPAILSLEPLATAHALIKDSSPQSCTMIVDLGGAKSTLIMATSETVLSTADGRSAGDELSRHIGDALRLDIPAAEEMKQKYGIIDGAKEYRTIVENYAAGLAARIHEVLSIALNHDHFCPAVSEILLTGGGALLKGLPEFLSRDLKIPTRLANTWVNVPSEIGTQVGDTLAPRFATACGFARMALTIDHSSSKYVA